MDAIQEAVNEYKIPNAWWSIPLINALERVNISLLIPWVADCILDLLSHERHDQGALVADRIRRVVATKSPEDIQDMLDEYDSMLHAFRSNYLLSYRHFVQAKQFFLNSDIVGLRTQLAWSLIFLGDCEYSRQSNIQYVIDSFSKMISNFLKNPP